MIIYQPTLPKPLLVLQVVEMMVFKLLGINESRIKYNSSQPGSIIEHSHCITLAHADGICSGYILTIEYHLYTLMNTVFSCFLFVRLR